MLYILQDYFINSDIDVDLSPYTPSKVSTWEHPPELEDREIPETQI